jgi:hypothetical protein
VRGWGGSFGHCNGRSLLRWNDLGTPFPNPLLGDRLESKGREREVILLALPLRQRADSGRYSGPVGKRKNPWFCRGLSRSTPERIRTSNLRFRRRLLVEPSFAGSPWGGPSLPQSGKSANRDNRACEETRAYSTGAVSVVPEIVPLRRGACRPAPMCRLRQRSCATVDRLGGCAATTMPEAPRGRATRLCAADNRGVEPNRSGAVVVPGNGPGRRRTKNRVEQLAQPR